MRPRKCQSTLIFLLKALIPYSRENMMLSFSPNQFFNELEKASSYKRKTLYEAARRAEQQGLIERRQQIISLSAAGKSKVRPYVATKLKNDARLMIIFDVPEENSTTRQRLRRVLKEWGFKQVQKSVWITDYDHRESVSELTDLLELNGCIRLYECSLLYK